MIPEPTEAMLPCPFCGSTPELMEGHRNHWRVECHRCGVRRAQFANGGVDEDKARAIRSWNAREPEAGKLREALEDARTAIASLDEDALGMGSQVVDFHDGREEPYPLRDELLARIDTALSRNQGR
jgi:Lar family restriction alleviation protein